MTVRFARFRWLTLVGLVAVVASAPAAAREPSRVDSAVQPTEAWTSSNPGAGGAMSTVGAGPTGVVLVASDLSGAYRSIDGGATWDMIGSDRGLEETHASGVGFDPRDENIMYVGTEDGIYRSKDRGITFGKVHSGGYVTDIEAAPDAPTRVYASVMTAYDELGGRVYRSDDRGRSWVSTTALPADVHILEIFVDATGEHVFALAGDGRFVDSAERLFHSRDGGTSWERIDDGAGTPLSLRLDAATPGKLWLSTREGDGSGSLHRSDDWGASWTEIADRSGIVWLPTSDVLRLIPLDTQFPWDDGRGIWESIDGGATWERVSDSNGWDAGWSEAPWNFGSGFNGWVKTIGIDLSNPERVYWATGQFVYEVAGDPPQVQPTFTERVGRGYRSTNLDNVVVFEASIPHRTGAVMYVGYWDLGCWVTQDHAKSWSNCNDPDESGAWQGAGGDTTTIIADPGEPGRVWAVHAGDRSQGLLQRSNSFGDPASWKPAEGLGRGWLFGLSLDPSSPVGNRVLHITRNGNVYRSTDDGRTWDLTFACGSCRSTAVGTDGSVYAAGATGVYRSPDGSAGSYTDNVTPSDVTLGDRWIEAISWGFQGPARVVVADGAVYIVVHGSDGGVWRSTNDGATWARIFSSSYTLDVAVDPADPDHIVVAGSSAYHAGGFTNDSPGVQESFDGGATWRSANVGLGWPFAARVDFTADGETQVVLSPGGGVHIRATNSAPVPSPTAAPTPGATSTPSPTPSPSGVPTRNRILVTNVIASGPAEYSFIFGDETQEILVGDWDGNGRDGFALRDGKTVTEYNERGVLIRTVTYGSTGDSRYRVGDWDGDGTDTLAVQRANIFFITNSPDATGPVVSIGFGRRDDEVFVGDWDNDGIDTFAVRRKNEFFVRNSVTTGPADITFGYGKAADEVLVGDWDTDGLDTFAVRRGNVIFIRNDFQTGVAETTIGFGKATDTLFVGDWNADNIDTFAVRRPE